MGIRGSRGTREADASRSEQRARKLWQRSRAKVKEPEAARRIKTQAAPKQSARITKTNSVSLPVCGVLSQRSNSSTIGQTKQMRGTSAAASLERSPIGASVHPLDARVGRQGGV